MTNQQILEKVIQKAIDGGWGGMDMNSPWSVVNDVWVNHVIAGETVTTHMNQYIFNHDFAKALWGDTKLTMLEPDVAFPKPFERWKFMLQFMVIADDPIKYLGENI